MNLKKIAFVSLLFFSDLTSSTTLFAAEQVATEASAEMMANTCTACHGPFGNSFGPAIPSIAGNSELYITDKMLAYKNGEMPSTIMANIAKGFSEDEIEKIAIYFANQKFIPAVQKFNKKLARAGKKIHKKYCEKCHSEFGTLAEDESGFLSGQWMLYLEYSLTDYHSGVATPTKKMRRSLKKMFKKEGSEGFRKLVHYYGSNIQ